jgi:EamA domain-containing membrane protein RarD
MTLLITTIAAIVTTLLWYAKSQKQLQLGTLALMYWGASIMWFVDAIFEYVEMGAEYFTQSIQDILNDTILGVCVVVLGMLIWLVIFLVKDPKGLLFKNRKK